MAKVSVLMASYNHERYIEEAVRSVLQQSFKDFELIVIDDASRDASPQILRTIEDPRMKFIEHTENMGVCRTLNEAFEMASGEYIALIASDDRWHGKKLKCQVDFLDGNPSCLAVFSTVNSIDAEGNIVKKPQNSFPERVSRWQVLRGVFRGVNMLNAPSEMLRRSAIDEGKSFYDLRFLQLQDINQHVSVALKGDIHVLPFPFVDYRWHGENLSRYTKETALRTDLEFAMVLDTLLAEIHDPATLNRIFPNLKTENIHKLLVPFILAQAALDSSWAQKHWGYTKIASYFESESRAEFLRINTGFTLKDFYQLASCLSSPG